MPEQNAAHQGWFYKHHNETHGPVSSAEIKDRARRGALSPDDPIWPEGGKPEGAVEAQAFLEFPSANPEADSELENRACAGQTAPEQSNPAPPSALPDWLGDVQELEKRGPAFPAIAPNPEAPEWLEDLRLWIGLDLYAQAQENPPKTPEGETLVGTAESAGGLPDWLAGFPTEKKTAGPEIPLGIPVAKPVRKRPSAPGKGKAKPPTTAKDVPVVRTVSREVVESLAQKAIAETGFDPQTGQILAPERFQKWKKQHAQSSSSPQSQVSNESMFEVFGKARREIDNWVDHENNKVFIELADLETIATFAEVKNILYRYQGYGPAMQEKLIHHLEFMVENRRKYYAALAQPP